MMHMARIKSLILALSANGFSFLIYSGIVIGIFMHLLKWWYVPSYYDVAVNILQATTLLGIIHIALQLLFFTLVRHFFHLNLRRLITVTLISNIFTIVLTYFYILFFMRSFLA
jgi:hypothetical protein